MQGLGWLAMHQRGKKETYGGKKVKLSNKLKTLEEQHMFQPSSFELKTSTTQKRFRIRRQSSKNAYLQTETSIQNRLLMMVQACFTLTISPLTQHSNRFTPTSMNLNLRQVTGTWIDFLTGLLSYLYMPKTRQSWKLLSPNQIQLAITKLALDKNPGEDGFSMEFYKCFNKVISPILLMLFNEIIKSESMPPSMRSGYYNCPA